MIAALARKLLVISVPLLVAGSVLAQTVTGISGPPTFQFSFSNPGARSMGFGGAFVALADDATAAFANPAGLVQITRPEVSLEGRYWDYSTPFVERGRFEGEPTGIGIDVIARMQGSVSSYDTAGPSSFRSSTRRIDGRSPSIGTFWRTSSLSPRPKGSSLALEPCAAEPLRSRCEPVSISSPTESPAPTA